MKKKFAFDSVEYDPSDINESTITEDNGVDTERVVSKVMTAVKTGRKTSAYSKRGIIGVAAAIAAVAAIGTVSVGAVGGFNQVFGNWFAGEPKYGLFPGDNISCSSDKKDIDFKGISGDDNFVGAAFSIKNKDGSSFVDSGDGTFVIYGSNDISVTESPVSMLFGHDINRGGSVWYRLEDKDTIGVTALYSDACAHLKGERMTIKEEKLYVYHLDKVIGGVENSFDDLTEKYKNEMKQNQTVFMYSASGAYEDNKYYIATEYIIPVDFELSVTLNYKTTTREIDLADGKQLSMNDVDMTINNVKANSFGMTVNATVGAIPFPAIPNVEGLSELDAMMADHEYIEKVNSLGFGIQFDITMKDGSKLTAKSDSRLIESNSETSSTGDLNCTYMKDGKFAVIDPDEIETVTAKAIPLEN